LWLFQFSLFELSAKIVPEAVLGILNKKAYGNQGWDNIKHPCKRNHNQKCGKSGCASVIFISSNVTNALPATSNILQS